MTTKQDDKAQRFESALERLEKLVAEMESGELGLEKMISHFEEGQGLIKVCTKKLNEVELRIEKLVNKGGRDEAVPLDDEAGDEGDDGPTELF